MAADPDDRPQGFSIWRGVVLLKIPLSAILCVMISARRDPRSHRAHRRSRRTLIFGSAIALVLGGGFLWLLDAQPKVLLDWLSARHEVVYRIPTPRPLVALTIDDSPSEVTPVILRVLAEHNALCTFFPLAARLEDSAAIARQIVAEGHELGNHLWEDRPALMLEREEFARVLNRSQARLESFGAPVVWFRPSSAAYQTWMVRIARQRGLRTVLGSVHPYDAGLSWVEYSVSQILRNTQPGDIVVLHDGVERGERTVQVLRRVLPELSRRGLRVSTLSELAASAR